MAGGRAFRPSAPRRAAFAALLTLLLLAFLSFLLSSGPALSRSSSSSSPSARLAAVRRHAADHAAVLAAYAAHARKLKEASAAQSLSFSTLSSDLSALSARLASHLSLPEDALKPLEKEARERIKLARALAADAKEGFDTQSKIQKLSDTVFAVGEQLARARRGGRMSSRIAAGSTPKSLHCLAMRLLEARLANPNPNAFADDPDPSPEFDDPSLYHYAVFSDNVLAVSVVVASAARAAADPSRHVFHVVTAPMYLPAFRVWFARRPPPLGVHVQLLAYSDFPFLNATNSPVIRQIEEGKSDVALLDYLRFYLPDMFPVLRRVVLLEDDVVVQKDLAALWQSDLDGKVNGAVEMCFGGFRRYRKYLNFTQPIVRDRFNPSACAWAYGVNVFDLQAWRRDGCTELFHQYMEMNEDGELWDPTSVLTAGLMTFYGNTKSLDKSWHVMGLGYNPSIGPEAIRSAAVIHFDGNMKPWLDVALNQYKALWTKYVDTEMEFLTLCNFGL